MNGADRMSFFAAGISRKILLFTSGEFVHYIWGHTPKSPRGITSGPIATYPLRIFLFGRRRPARGGGTRKRFPTPMKTHPLEKAPRRIKPARVNCASLRPQRGRMPPLELFSRRQLRKKSPIRARVQGGTRLVLARRCPVRIRRRSLVFSIRELKGQIGHKSCTYYIFQPLDKSDKGLI